MSAEPDEDEDESDDPEEVFVEREIERADPEAVELRPDHAPRRDHQRRLVDVVADWLAQNRSYVEVVDLAMEATGCSPSTAKRAIAEARRRWDGLGASDPAADRRRYLARLDMDWRGASEDRDYRASAAIARTYADVAGFRAPLKVEHSGQVGIRPIAAMSPAERRAEIAELRAKQIAAGEKPVDGEVVEVAAVPARKRGN